MAEYGDFCQWFSAIAFRVRRCAVMTCRRVQCSIRRNLRTNVRDHANPRDSQAGQRSEIGHENFSQLCETEEHAEEAKRAETLRTRKEKRTDRALAGSVGPGRTTGDGTASYFA